MRLPSRLSPKAVFIGLVALGLPVAVTIGWALATPTGPAPASFVSAPGGSGSIGTAPARDDQPAVLVDQVLGDEPSPAAGSARSKASPAPTASSTPPPSGTPDVTVSGMPPLTDPPVPTPTDVTSSPPSASASPSAGTSSEPSLSLLRQR